MELLGLLDDTLRNMLYVFPNLVPDLGKCFNDSAFGKSSTCSDKVVSLMSISAEEDESTAIWHAHRNSIAELIHTSTLFEVGNPSWPVRRGAKHALQSVKSLPLVLSIHSTVTSNGSLSPVRYCFSAPEAITQS